MSPMRPRPLRRRNPFVRINDLPADKQEQAKKVLHLVRAAIQTNMGTDANPSKMLVALGQFEEVDTDVLEIVQDALLFVGDDLISSIIDHLGDPEGFMEAFAPLALAFGFELKRDIDAAR